MPDMKDDIKEILISEEQLKETVARIGSEISRDYAGKKPILPGWLVWSNIWLIPSELPRLLKVP